MAGRLGDGAGHGTACAGIVRSLAPACRLHSVRVLGAGNTGSGELILGGLRHAIESGFDVVNLSLSTTKRRFAELLHELADNAYFKGTVLVAAVTGHEPASATADEVIAARLGSFDPGIVKL